MHKMLLPLVVVSLSSLAGCPVPDGMTSEELTLTDVATEYQRLVGLCSQPTPFQARVQPNFTPETLSVAEIEAELTKDRQGFGALDTTKIGACIDFLAGFATCNDWLYSPSRGACDELFPPAQDQGEVCGTSSECIDGQCGINMNSDCGVCVPTLAQGTACGDDVTGQCDRDSYCNETCVALGASTPPATFSVGDACNNDCNEWSDSGLLCIDELCVAMEVVALGGACDVLPGSQGALRICEGVFFSDNHCASSDNVTGTCTSSKPAGAACVTSLECQDALQCDNATCTAAPPQCSSNADCASDEICEDNECNFVETQCF